jgi:hypothetical protein
MGTLRVNLHRAQENSAQSLQYLEIGGCEMPNRLCSLRLRKDRLQSRNISTVTLALF